MKKENAFTLAEVLITLGIIGIVVAMTLPTLIANHRKQVTVTKLKKIYTVMNQAINMSVAEYGDVKNWAADCGSSSNTTCTTEEAMEWFNKYIGKNLQIIKTEKDPNDEKRFLVYFKDGSILGVYRYIFDMAFYIDSSALKNIRAGVNSFNFNFKPVLFEDQLPELNIYAQKSTFEPYSWSWDGTRNGLIHANNGYGCGEKHNAYCAKLIQYEGWQIPKDYPLKF